MAKSKTYTVPYKRKIKGKTNYKKRLNYLKSGKVRFVIRPSTNDIIFQAVKYELDGDKILLTIKTKDIKKLGWKYSGGNLPAAYLTGLLFGKKVQGIAKEGIIDIGLQSITKGSRITAAIKGIADSGVEFNYDEAIFPSEDAVSGKIIEKFATQLTNEKEKYEKQFSKYLKNNSKPEEISKNFEEIKIKVMGNEK